ncbi:MAG: hypothetical protein GX638_04390 [Crenarchaeota archaeon]|nr:hypothetical protein [Thermoproteota archaeon]
MPKQKAERLRILVMENIMIIYSLGFTPSDITIELTKIRFRPPCRLSLQYSLLLELYTLFFSPQRKA